jgi:hypothetical protein
MKDREWFSKQLYIIMQELLNRDTTRVEAFTRIEEAAEAWVEDAVRESERADGL